MKLDFYTISRSALDETFSRDRVITTVAVITGRSRADIAAAVRDEDARLQATTEAFNESTFMRNLLARLKKSL
jgi:hypothetical protein